MGPHSVGKPTFIFNLTRFLADKAGFSALDAQAIAVADESYDCNPHDAAVTSMAWSLLFPDDGAARDLKYKHFPSDGQAPGLPRQRVVIANGKAAPKPVEDAIRPTDLGDALSGLAWPSISFRIRARTPVSRMSRFAPVLNPIPTTASATREDAADGAATTPTSPASIRRKPGWWRARPTNS